MAVVESAALSLVSCAPCGLVCGLRQTPVPGLGASEAQRRDAAAELSRGKEAPVKQQGTTPLSKKGLIERHAM